MNGQYRIGDVVLDNWTLVKPLGEGAFGKVYEARREEYGTSYAAAIKIMTIPSSPSEIENARAEGMDDESVRAYFNGFVGSVVNEVALMSELKGTANVVSCEDFRVEEHTDGLGWDILIRMELLTPMLKHMSASPLTRSDIIKLGIDMCKALELCQRCNIIHRDIKPENIFVSRTGDYKLGDFGVARTLEKTTGGLSKKGTYTYMAPEIYRDEDYGSTVDIYSLGIVLYRLLNNNRAPFLPPPPQAISYAEREEALQRRIGGEPLPPPANAEGRLSEIVLKACAYDPRERYSSPLQMRQELEAIRYARGDDELIYGRDETIRVERSQYTNQHATAVGEEDGEKTVSAAAQGGGRKKKKTGLIALIAAVVVLGAVALGVLLPKLKASDPTVSPAPTPAPAPTAVPTPEPTPEETPAPEEEAAPEETPVPEEEPESSSETAEIPWVEGHWSWSIKGGVLTISGTGNMANYKNTSERPWEKNVDSISRVVIEDGITGIGSYAFHRFWKMHAVTIPESVTVIGDHAFSSCGNMTRVTMKSSAEKGGVERIGERAFENCYALGSVTFSDGLVSIGPQVFNTCWGLKRVTIPARVEEIAPQAFIFCKHLTKIEVAQDSPYFKTVDGAVYTADGSQLVVCPGGRSASLRIPEGVVKIRDGAFSGCYSISGVTIPGSVREIGSRAFVSCLKLTKLKIPEGVETLGEQVFSSCSHLGSVSLPASLTVIGKGVFSHCDALSKIEVAADNPNYKSLGGVLFSKDGTALIRYPSGKNGASYTIPEGVTEIGEYAFYNCGSLGSVTLPDGLTTIGEYAFHYSQKIRSFSLPESLTTIGRFAFNNCDALTSVTIPGGVALIETYAFSDCERLRSVTVSEGVTVIGKNVFSNCESLSSITLPQTLAKIDSGAFRNCGALKTVSFRGNQDLWSMVTIGESNEPLTGAKVVFDAS